MAACWIEEVCNSTLTARARADDCGAEALESGSAARVCWRGTAAATGMRLTACASTICLVLLMEEADDRLGGAGCAAAKATVSGTARRLDGVSGAADCAGEEGGIRRRAGEARGKRLSLSRSLLGAGNRCGR